MIKWLSNPALFWTIWGIEAAFMYWWLMRYLRISFQWVNPNIYRGWLLLLIAMALYLSGIKIVALIIVGIGALPLLFMGLYLLLILVSSLFGPIRWN